MAYSVLVRCFFMIFVLLAGCDASADTLGAGESSPSIKHTIHVRGGFPHLEVLVDESRIISPDHAPLYTETHCAVDVRAETIDEGVLLHFTVRNDGEVSSVLPVIQIPGVQLPRNDIQIIENRKNIFFRKPHPTRQRHMLHAMQSYPELAYSPVLGMKTDDVFVATALMYDVFTIRREVNMDYRFDRRSGTWSMEYRFWDQRPHLEDGRAVHPPNAELEPHESIAFTIAVTAAHPSQWLTAYRPYRDYFQHKYGSVRYERSGEPIFAQSLGNAGIISDETPKGYHRHGAAGYGRMDRFGWTGYFAHSRDVIRAMGYKRALLWHVAGSYRQNLDMNMSWEITSAWEPVMNETVEELTRAIAEGLEVGLWWGIAFAVSGGFDSGVREPWDPDNLQHNAAAFRELDRAYELGVRLIGLDATPRGILGSRHWSPSSDVLFNRIFPMLYERYPEMKWIIEPAACDFLHLWGSSFMWVGDVHGPFEFAEYIAPGSESHAVLHRIRPPSGSEGFAHLNQDLLDRVLKWGYTPIVFEAPRFGLRIDRDLLTRGSKDSDSTE